MTQQSKPPASMASSAAMVQPPDEYTGFFGNYIKRVHGDVFEFLRITHAALHTALAGLTEGQAEAHPAPNEWSIKEVVGHISDTERIFAYRALRFARGDATPLAGFEQDEYVATGSFNKRTLRDLLDELDAVRSATLALFHSLSDEALTRRGTAASNVVSARALLLAIAGHEDHHLQSLREVYLSR